MRPDALAHTRGLLSDANVLWSLGALSGFCRDQLTGVRIARTPIPATYERVWSMRVRVLSGHEYDAIITTDHPASTYGLPVLVVNGEPMGAPEVTQAGFVIINATTAEWEALAAGGYALTDCA